MIFIYLIFFLFSLGQIGRISFFGQQVNIYLYELLLSISLLPLILKYKLESLKQAFKMHKEIFVFFVVLLFSYLIELSFFTANQNAVAFLYLLRLALYFFAFIYIGWIVKRKPNFSKKILQGLLFFIILTPIFSLAQYFLYPDLRNLFYLGWDPHLSRAFGLYLDTSVAAAIYGIALLFLLVNFSKIKLSTYSKLMLILVYSIMGMLTYSRGFYVAMLLTLTVYLVSRKKYFYILLLTVIFFLSLMILPKKFGEGVNLLRTFSVDSRFQDDKVAISIWQRKPLLGIGYNRIRYEKERLGLLEKENEDVTHSGASFPSSFLIVLVTSGIVGLLAFIFALLKLAKNSELAKLLIIFTAVFSLTDNILLHPFVLFLLFTLLLSGRKAFNYRSNNLR